MINELYIKQAINIRRKYLDIKRDISAYEKTVKEILEIIQIKVSELQGLQKKIVEKKFNSVDSAKNEMTRIILNLESEINVIDKKIKKLNQNIEDLQKEEMKLFKDIKISYPKLKDSEIRQTIQKEVSKFLD